MGNRKTTERGIVCYEGLSEQQLRIVGQHIRGYGLAITNIDNLIPGKSMTGHTGSAYGLYSAMFFQRKEKFGFVVITNGCNPSYTDGISTVLRTTINSLYDNFIRSAL